MSAETPQDATPALRDLMAAVGYLLLFWSHCERLLGGRPMPDELKYVRRMRNDLCHSMRSAHADPSDAHEPHIRCASTDRGSVTYTWTDLQRAIRDLERFNGQAPRGH